MSTFLYDDDDAYDDDENDAKAFAIRRRCPRRRRS